MCLNHKNFKNHQYVTDCNSNQYHNHWLTMQYPVPPLDNKLLFQKQIQKQNLNIWHDFTQCFHCLNKTNSINYYGSNTVSYTVKTHHFDFSFAKFSSHPYHNETLTFLLDTP